MPLHVCCCEHPRVRVYVTWVCLATEVVNARVAWLAVFESVVLVSVSLFQVREKSPSESEELY